MVMIEAQTSGLSCIASSVVTEETNVDGRAVYLSMEEQDSVWVKTLLSAPVRSIEAFDRICRKYQVSEVVKKIAEIYST